MPSPSSNLRSYVSLNQLRVPVHLGCSPEERSRLQNVLLDVLLEFSGVPRGSHSDLLEDTFCYARISDEVIRVCRQSEYQLIEKLGFEVFQAIRSRIPAEVRLQVRITKEKPPISELQGGASFEISDLPSSGPARRESR